MKHETIGQAAAEASSNIIHEPVHEAYYQDPRFWVALAFVIFVVLAAKYVWPMIAKGLDKRADAIRDQLEQAQRLRAEAEELLTSYQHQRKRMLKEAEDILAHATRDAAMIRSKASEELKQTLARRTAQAEEGIARAEAEATAQLKAYMVEIATQATRQVVAEQLADKKDDPTVARALAAIERQIH